MMCDPSLSPQFGRPGTLRYETANNFLPEPLETNFQRDLYFAPGWRDWRRQFMDREGGPPNTDPGGDYNYRLAWMHGAKPEVDPGSGEVHGFSQIQPAPFASPVELKSDNHPTMWKQRFMDRFGANPDVLAQRGGPFTDDMGRFVSELLGKHDMSRKLTRKAAGGF